MTDLTIMSVVYNDNQTKLFDLMYRSVLKFTSPTPNFVVCDNGGNDLGQYQSPTFKIVKGQSTNHGSLQHGESLNQLMPYATTQRTAIIEPDVVVLCEGWDELNFPKTKMMASIKGHQAGQPYYHICFLLFGTQILKYNGIIDFRPGKDGNRGNRAYKPWEDVAWRLREKVRPDEICELKFVDCKEAKGQLFNSRFQSDELWLNDKLYFGHWGRGSNINGKAVRQGFESNEQQLHEWKEIVERKLK